MPSHARTLIRRFLPVLLVGALLAALPAWAADQFVFVNPPSTLVTYVVNSSAITFVVNAYELGAPQGSFADQVTIGFYKNDQLGSYILEDPQAVFLDGAGVTIGTGTATPSFTAGAVTFSVVFKTGSDSNATLVVRHPDVPLADAQRGPYSVIGFQTDYFPKDASIPQNGTPAVYPALDELITDSAAITAASDTFINIPFSDASGTNALAYVITGVDGRYAFGNSDILSNLVARRDPGGPSGSTNIMYRIILDYDGFLSDYNNPVQGPGGDTVYQNGPLNVLTTPVTLGQATLDSLYPDLDKTSTGFQNGQIILRVWTLSSPATSQPQLRIRSTAPNLSFLRIPYSDSNVSPVQAQVVPNQALAANPATLVYTLTNFSGSALTSTTFKIPGNPSPAGTNWTLQETPTTARAGQSISYTNPSGTSDGSVSISWTTPMAITESVPITLTFSTTSSVIQPNWDFGFLGVEPPTSQPDPNSAKNVETLDVPPAPDFLTAVPANYASPGTGNRVDLAWDQVTEQSANGYILTRRDLPAGSPVTIATPTSNTVTTFQDTGAVNLTPYEYVMVAKNNVAVSPPVTISSPVTAFANPGPPLNLQALSGGTTVQLSWATPVPNLSNAYPVTGYQVFRSTTQAGVTTSSAVVTVAASPFNDTGADIGSLSAGTTYFYRVASVDNQAVTGTPGTGAHVSGFNSTNGIGHPPGNPPTGAGTTLVTSSPATIGFSWTAPVSNLAAPVSYVIGRGVDGGPLAYYTEVPASSVSILDDAVTAGSFYTYAVAGLSAGPVTTNFTAAVTGRVGPSAPSGFTASPSSPSGTAVTLTWNPNPAPEGVVNYRIYRDSVFLAQTGTSPTSFLNNSGLVVGTDYVYEIEAVDSQPVTGPRAAVTTALRPPALTGLNLTVSTSNTVTFTWNTPAEANAQGVSVFKNGVYAATLPVTNLYLDPGQPDNVSVTYTAQSFNLYSSGPTATPVSIVTYPGAVNFTSLNLNADGSRAASWINLTAPVTGYQVFRSQVSGGPYVPVQSITGANPSMPITLNQSIQPGQAYYYVVQAGNSTGRGPDSNEQTVNVPPSVPIGLTAVSGVSNTGVTVDLTWLPNAPIENANNYTLYRSPDNSGLGSYTAIASGVTLAGGATILSYSDATVADGQDYFYLVTANSQSFSAESPLVLSNAVAVTAFALPNPPSGMAVTAGTGQVFLGWTAPAQTTYPIVGYNIYRSTSSPVAGGVPINATPVPGTAYTATGLTNGTTYYFAVRSVDLNGNLGPLSSEVSEMPVVRPNPPTSMAASPGDREVALTWVPPTVPAGSLSPQSYLIYRRTPPATGPITLIAQIGVTFNGYNDNNGGIGVTTGVTYEYWVQTVDSSGVTSIPHISLESTHVTETPALININPPSNVVGTAGNGTFQIDWVDSFTPGAAVTGYGVWRRVGGTGAFSGVVTVGAGVQTYTDSPVNNGFLHEYYLVAIADTSPSPTLSANSAIVSGTPAPPPGTPTGLSAVDGFTQVILSWGPVAPTGVVTIQNYVVYQNAVSIASVSGPVTSYTAGSLTNGTLYSFTVSAVNSNGTEGNPSIPIIGRPFDMVAPTGVGSTSTATEVTFSWTDLTGPYPGASSTYPVNGYNVVRTPLGAGIPVTFADPDGTFPFVDNTGVLAQLYTYQVQGTDDQGHLGPFSAPVTDAISNPPPLPSPISVHNGNEQVLLDWAPATVVTGSLPVSQYRITIDGTTQIYTTQTWYLDTTASNGVPVNYTIESIDVTGQVSSPAHISTASAPAAVTPDANLLNPPTGLTAVPLTPNSIRLNWVPSADQGLDVDYYVITRANSFTGTYSSPITIDADAFPPVVSMAVTQLAADRTYYFVMRAYERTPGTRVSSPSNHAYATTPANPGGSGDPAGDLFFDRNVMLLFNSETLAINYIPSESGEAVVKIYTVAGHPILTLAGGTAAAGVQYSLTWDGLDRNGFPVASGLYLIEVTVGKFHMVKKVAVVK